MTVDNLYSKKGSEIKWIPLCLQFYNNHLRARGKHNYAIVSEDRYLFSAEVISGWNIERIWTSLLSGCLRLVPSWSLQHVVGVFRPGTLNWFKKIEEIIRNLCCRFGSASHLSHQPEPSCLFICFISFFAIRLLLSTILPMASTPKPSSIQNIKFSLFQRFWYSVSTFNFQHYLSIVKLVHIFSDYT